MNGPNVLPTWTVSHCTFCGFYPGRVGFPMSLPPPWQVCFSPEGHKYYYNEKTMESVWELPRDVAAAVAEGVDALRNGGSWKLFCDAENHPFYFNATTNQSRWAQPEDWERHNDAVGRPYFYNVITGDSVWAQEDDDDDPDGAVKAEPKKTKKKSTWYRNLSDALADSRYGASAIETHDTAPAPHNGYASDFPTYEFMVTRKSKLKEHEIEVREAAKARRARSGKHPASPTAAARHATSGNDSASSDGGSKDETSDESDDSDVEAGHRRRGSRHRTSSKVLRKLEKAGDGQPALMPLLVNWVLRVVKRALSTTRAVSGKAVSIIGAAGSSAAVKLADYSVVAASYIGEGMEHAAAAAGPVLDSFIQKMDSVVGVSMAIVDSATVGSPDIESNALTSSGLQPVSRPPQLPDTQPSSVRNVEQSNDRPQSVERPTTEPSAGPSLARVKDDGESEAKSPQKESETPSISGVDGTQLDAQVPTPTSPNIPPPEVVPPVTPVTPVAPASQPNLE